MLQFVRNIFRAVPEGEDTGTFADATLQMTDFQRDFVNAKEHGHQSYQRDYGHTRKIHRRSMGFA